MSDSFNASTAVNISILKNINKSLQTSQKRISTGKQILTAADDTTRYKMSQTMIGRAGALDSINNNISLGLTTLSATSNTLKQIISLAQNAQTIVRKAQSEGTDGARAVTATADISSSTVVSTASVGSKFSITSDSGQNFTYTFQNTTTTWGQVADALNNANIGVKIDFVPSATSGQSNIRFTSTNGKDFTLDAVSDEAVMANLVGLTSPTGQIFNSTNLFGAAATAPTATETGFTVAFGGVISGIRSATLTSTSAISTGSTLVLKDSNGQVRTYTAPGGSTVASLISSINSWGIGIKADLVNQDGAGKMQFRIRSTTSGDVQILAGTNQLAASGAVFSDTAGISAATIGLQAPLSTSANNALRMRYGTQYDSIVANINDLIANNPVQAGRNLLTGQTMSIVMDETSSTPLSISGQNITGSGNTNNSLGFTTSGIGSSWTNDTNIQTAAVNVGNAIKILSDLQADLATFSSYIQSRYDINQTASTDLKTLGDNVTDVEDLAEESAKQTALQTQQQFAIQALTSHTQSENNLLRLLQ